MTKRTTRQPKCTCPACLPDYYTNANGVFYCVVTNDYTAYADNQPLSSHKYDAQATEALGVYQRDAAAQASREITEAQATELDLAADVEDAASEPDVIAALAAATHAANAALDTFSDETVKIIDWIAVNRCPIIYSRVRHGFIFDGCTQPYQTYTEADNARTGR